MGPLFPKPTRKRDPAWLQTCRESRCIVCGNYGFPGNPITPSHIQTKGSGGSDGPENVVPMHLSEHRLWEDDRFSFCIQYPRFMRTLDAMGFEFVDYFGVMKLRKK